MILLHYYIITFTLLIITYYFITLHNFANKILYSQSYGFSNNSYTDVRIGP